MSDDVYDEDIHNLFGHIHQKVRNWIESGDLNFEHNLSKGSGDALDTVIFTMLDLRVPGSWAIDVHAGAWIREVDRQLRSRDLRWLYSDHGLTLLKAKLVQKGITDVTWTKTES